MLLPLQPALCESGLLLILRCSEQRQWRAALQHQITMLKVLSGPEGNARRMLQDAPQVLLAELEESYLRREVTLEETRDSLFRQIPDLDSWSSSRQVEPKVRNVAKGTND